LNTLYRPFLTAPLIIFSPVKAKSDGTGFERWKYEQTETKLSIPVKVESDRMELQYIYTQQRPQVTFKWATAFNCLINRQLFTYCFDKKMIG
jgi:hypothetical protein